MSDVALRVENLGKQYIIGHGKTARYETLSERITGVINAPMRSIQSVLRGQSPAVASDSIWALKHVSFEVKHGEVVGIIGRNGAGKSTLLKILSQITEPTEGAIDIYGRVGTLLEVGTGFHPELTGRENVYLNGAILGMKRAEIKRKFDEIIDFSGIEKFIDTPVKHYSTGMQVRLAFAVAAHLEPEILLVDEVLAVGDAEFQKKCLGKMGEVSHSGRTVLFVSHNLSAITSLCGKCIWIDQGNLKAFGTSLQIVQDYLSSHHTALHNNGIITDAVYAHEPRGVCFKRIQILNHNGEAVQKIFFNDPVCLRIEFDVTESVTPFRLGAVIQRLDGIQICALHYPEAQMQEPLDLPPGAYCAEIKVDIPLTANNYTVDLFAKPYPGFWGSPEHSLHFVQQVIGFSVENISRNGVAVLSNRVLVQPAAEWHISVLNGAQL